MYPAFSRLISPSTIIGVLTFVVQNYQTLNVMPGWTKHVNSDNILIVSVSWGKQHYLLWKQTLSEPKCFLGFSFVCLWHWSTLYWQNKVKVWHIYLSVPFFTCKISAPQRHLWQRQTTRSPRRGSEIHSWPPTLFPCLPSCHLGKDPWCL